MRKKTFSRRAKIDYFFERVGKVTQLRLGEYGKIISNLKKSFRYSWIKQDFSG